MDYRIKPVSRTGKEVILGTEHTLLDYWQWAHSDIVSNAERGKLAEFIVKCAVGCTSPFRVEWDAVDIVTPRGIRIEVKSSSYLQSWKCHALSKIQFDIAPKKSWDSEENQYYETIGRNSDFYVFCLFAAKNPDTADILDLKQWEFYVLSTEALNTKAPFQKSIGLNSLMKLGAKQTDYQHIRQTIDEISKYIVVAQEDD